MVYRKFYQTSVLQPKVVMVILNVIANSIENLSFNILQLDLNLIYLLHWDKNVNIFLQVNERLICFET